LREIQMAQMEAMEKRFETMERANQQRFEALQREMDKRFEAVDKRFEVLERRMTFLQWSIGIGFTLMSTLIGLATYLLAR